MYNLSCGFLCYSTLCSSVTFELSDNLKMAKNTKMENYTTNICEYLMKLKRLVEIICNN